MWESSGTRKKEEESNPLPTFSQHQAFSRVGGNFAPKGEKIDSWKREMKKILLFLYKVQIYIKYINRYTVYMWCQNIT